jgi:hypothetical protein
VLNFFDAFLVHQIPGYYWAVARGLLGLGEKEGGVLAGQLLVDRRVGVELTLNLLLVLLVQKAREEIH